MRLLLMTVALLTLAGANFSGTSFAQTPANQGFRDCPTCPEMAVLPAGKFSMGGAFTDEGPSHDVIFKAPFAVARTEVTFDEWEACVADNGCRHKPSDEKWGRGKRPVINVSWLDAQQYLLWISRKTGERYRLLTEAEWEYAARAGTMTEYSWGDDVGRNNANCVDCGSTWDNKQTAPVNSFKPNAWGLSDMSGNVWEWVEDCYHSTYEGAAQNGAAWVEKCEDGRRVVRGGSWSFKSESLRSAYRGAYKPATRGGFIGFRIAKTLK